MSAVRSALAGLACAALIGCAAAPPAPSAPAEAPVPAPTLESVLPAPEPATPLVEYPPLEPAETRAPAPPAALAPAPLTPLPAEGQPAPLPATPPAVAPPPPELAEEAQVSALIADLARYPSLAPDDVRKEVASVTQTLNRQRTDANRVRLAMLYTMSRAPQDDQRALQLLEGVTKSNSGPAAVKQLAGVLQSQVSERMRVAREEQQKAAAAIQKLEALRSLERSLLRDRVRGGGGGSSGGSSGGGGGG